MKSARQALHQALASARRKTPPMEQNVTPPRSDMDSGERGRMRARMRRTAKRAGRPEPTMAEFAALGCGIMSLKDAREKIAETMKLKECAGLRLCGVCGIDLDRMGAPRPEESPEWRCAIPRCKGPLTKADIAAINQRGDGARA
jgi:hypothetical protein